MPCSQRGARSSATRMLTDNLYLIIRHLYHVTVLNMELSETHWVLCLRWVCIITAGGSFYQHGLTVISTWIRNHMFLKVWDEITYPFLNFNSAAVEVWEWKRNFIPHFIMDVITYQFLLKGSSSHKMWIWQQQKQSMTLVIFHVCKVQHRH